MPHYPAQCGGSPIFPLAEVISPPLQGGAFRVKTLSLFSRRCNIAIVH